MLRGKIDKLSSIEKTNVIFTLIHNLSFDQLLDVKKIVGEKVFDDETWEELLENYNPEYYNILKDYEFNVKNLYLSSPTKGGNSFQWKELYLDFLEIEKDNKEDLLEDFILNGINSKELTIYSELQKLISENYFTDLPEELFITMTQGLKYNDIINLCTSDAKMRRLCDNANNWKLMFKIKYSKVLEYLTKKRLDNNVNYKEIIKQLSNENLREYYIESLKKGNLYAVMILFEDYKDFSLNYALNKASENGHVEIVEFLLKNGADVHNEDDYSLTIASQNGYFDVVELLLENGANVHADNDYSIRRASANGFPKIVKILLENKADVHAGNDYSLHWASRDGHFDVVKILLKYGADVHSAVDFSLRTASENGHFDVVKILLKYGADVHSNIDASLRFSSKNGHLDVVKILLEYGADVHAYNDGPLRVAEYDHRDDIVKLLLEFMGK